MAEKQFSKKLRQKLQTLEEELKRYRELFEKAPIGIFQSTLESSRFINVNPAMARLLGYETPEACISSIKHIDLDVYIKPETRKELLEKTIENGELLNFETSFRNKGCHVLNSMIHARIARSDDGSPAYLEGFCEDISGQKKILEALKQSEEHYRSIFENTGAGTIIAEEDMTISLANDEFARMSGYSRSEIEGKMKWNQVVANPDDQEKMMRYHKKRREIPDAAPKNYEFILVSKTGSKKNILARVDVIPGTGKSVGSFIDITPVVRAQQKIRQSESKLRGILAAFEGFIYTCTSDYRIMYMNKNLRDFTGQPAFGGERCYEIIFGRKSPCPWCPMKPVFNGETIKQELHCRRTGRWYYAVSIPILDIDDKTLKMQSFLIDIHERKKAEMDMKAREAHLHKENVKLRSSIQDRYKFCGIVGKSRPMQKVYELILRAGMSDLSVILYGESGTGKELVARAIHDMSHRSGRRFVPVNCGAIPATLLESEFFGVKKGAFTGASNDREGFFDHAQGGTLFLDELGEIDLNIQVKLLRVLEGSGYTPVGGREVKKTDVRIIAATNRDLNELVSQGAMREDFFYRIHILPIYLPPLRERKEDIPLLVEHFYEKYNIKSPVFPLPGKILDELQTHDWPGNVRELENTFQRYINLDNLEFLSPRQKQGPDHTELSGLPLPSEIGYPDLKAAVGWFEKRYITRILEQNQWRREKTAKVLGVGRKTLYSKIKALGIEKKENSSQK